MNLNKLSDKLDYMLSIETSESLTTWLKTKRLKDMENKTIEVSAEMHDKLIQLATEMTTQDPRGTRGPHIFQIRDYKKVYDWNLNGDVAIWVNDYGTEIETLDEFKEYLTENDIAIPEDIEAIWDEGQSWHYDMEEFLEENEIELKRCSYTFEPVYVNAFFTAKAAEEHLRLNHYHYHKDADVYLSHGWRNPEMEMVVTFLCNLVGKEMHT